MGGGWEPLTKPGGKQHCPCLGEGRPSPCSLSGVMGNTTSGSGIRSSSGMLVTRCLMVPSEGTLPAWSSPRYGIQPWWVMTEWSPEGSRGLGQLTHGACLIRSCASTWAGSRSTAASMCCLWSCRLMATTLSSLKSRLTLCSRCPWNIPSEQAEGAGNAS